jgi:hypothetical protein
MTVQTFSTRGSPREVSARLFEDRMHSLFSVGLMVNSDEAAPLETELTAYCGRRLHFASLRFSPHTTHAEARYDSGVGRSNRYAGWPPRENQTRGDVSSRPRYAVSH